MKKSILLIFCSIIVSDTFLNGQGVVPSSAIDHSLGIHQPKYLAEAFKQTTQLKPLYDSIWFWLNETAWSPINKYIDFTYDSNGNLTSETEQGYNIASNPWVNNGLYTYAYNSSGLVTISEYSQWNSTVWVYSSKTITSYTSFNKDSLITDMKWQAGAWVNSGQYIYTYNGQSLLMNQLYQTWNSGAWVNNNQYIYSYNSLGLDTNCIYQTWNGTAWVNSTQNIYTYNIAKKDSINLLLSWNDTVWVNSSVDTMTYNSSNLKIKDVSYNFHDTVWSYNSTSTYTYNSSDDLIGDFYYSYAPNGFGQQDYGRYIYDANNIKTSEYHQMCPQCVEDSTAYYFHKTVAGIDGIKNNKGFVLYPNPNKGDFIIENKSGTTINGQLSIYNTVGQKVYEINVKEFNASLPLSLHFSPGLYFLNISNNSGILMRQKLIIQN